MAVSHVYSNAVPDGTATSVVRPSDWNSAHNQYMTIAGNTAGASTLSGTNIVFQGGNNLTLSANGQTLIFSGANAGGAQTGISSIVVSDATYTSGQVSFSQGNGISFASGAGQAISITHGLQFTSNTSNITSNALNTNAARVQSVNGSSGAISLNVGSSLSASTNGSSITFGLASNITTALQSAGAYLTTAAQSNHSHNFATTTTNGALVVVGTTNSAGATIGVPPFITTAMASNAVTLSNINVSAGTTSNNLSALTFNNGNGVTFGLNAGTITASVAAAGGAQTGLSGVIASNATYTSGTFSLSDANGISFNTGAGQAIGITHALQYTSATSAITSNALHSSASKVAGIVANTNNAGGGTATLTGNVSFSNANGLSFYTSAGNAVVGSYTVPTQTVQPAIQSIIVSNTTYTTGAVSFSNANGLTFGSSAGGAITGSHNGLTTAAQSNHSHNLATTTTNGSLIVVATTNSAGATVAVPPYITTYAAQTNQTANFYVSGNTTQLSSTAGLDLRSISFEGAGIASVGVSNGRVLVSVPSGGGAGDGYNIVYAGTAGTTGTTWSSASASVRINGGNNITVSQNGSNDIVISAAQGGIAAGTQTATSGTLVFANSNGVTFGMSGSSQITASVNAGGVDYTAMSLQNRQLGASTTLLAGGGQNSLWLAPVRVAAPVSASTIIAAMVSYSGTITSAATAQAGHTIRCGIWSQHTDPASTSRFDTWWTGAASITFWNSGTSSVSYNFSLAGGATTSSSAGSNLLTASAMGVRKIIIPIGSTMPAGLYVFGVLNSTSTAGYSAAMSRMAAYFDNPISIGMGTIGQATNNSNGFVDGGTYLTTTGALPNTLALNQIGGVANVMPYFRIGAI